MSFRFFISLLFVGSLIITAHSYAQDVGQSIAENEVVGEGALSEEPSTIEGESTLPEEPSTIEGDGADNFDFSKEQLQRMEGIRSVLDRTGLAGELSNDTLEKTAQEIIDLIVFSDPKIFPFQMKTMFFTDEELELIISYENGATAANPDEAEINTAEEQLELYQVGSGIREISLAGILYVSKKDWIIWMNGQKMTPKILAPEIIDIEVQKDFIRVDWYDSQSNQIFPIKLKPHQRFNIDSRIFLPG